MFPAVQAQCKHYHTDKFCVCKLRETLALAAFYCPAPVMTADDGSPYDGILQCRALEVLGLQSTSLLSTNRNT